MQYAVKTLFDVIGLTHYQLTDDVQFYSAADAYKINYSATAITKGELLLQPHGLLFESNIHKQTITCFHWNNVKAFFKTGGALPFDIFSASFFLLTRYEEYLPHTLDMYERYAHTNSIAYGENFLHLPLINLWLLEFQKVLLQHFPQLIFKREGFRFVPTYDVDIAYSYKGKGLQRNIAAGFKDLLTGKWKSINERICVLKGRKKDPFDTYDWLNSLHQKYHLKPIYFFLLAAQQKGYDKNIDVTSTALQTLVRTIKQQQALLGIHPSWQSGDDEQLFSQEPELLQSLSETQIDKSRQHYIRVHLPDTYRLLLKYKIEHDFSMGYGSINGFRASIASPFNWYDLKREAETQLVIHPFCFMDANAFFEQHFTAMQAGEELQRYLDVIKEVDGEMITIFHNHFVTEQQQWLPWRLMYADFLNRNFNVAQ